MNNTYYNELKKLKKLDDNKIKEIYENVEKGEYFHKELNKIIESNLKFVVVIAKKYYSNIKTLNSIIELDDLINEGNYGLIQACQKFSLKFGVKFSTYAIFWIKKEIINCINKHSQIIKIPYTKIAEKRQINKVISEFVKKYNYYPTFEDLQILELFTDKQLKNFFRYNNQFLKIEDQNIQIFEDLEEVEDFNKELNLKIKVALKYLTEKEKLYVEMKFGINQPAALPKEICQKLGVTKARVTQIKFSALKKLKEILSNNIY